MSNKTEHFPTDMREGSTEIVNPNRQLETGMRQDINSNTQIDKEGYYSILYNSITRSPGALCRAVFCF